MADVIGPNSYLPGQKIKVPAGAMCDEHPDRPAVCRIVGETDSFVKKETLEEFEPYQGSYKARNGSEKPPKNKLKNKAGCYVITHCQSGSIYIGSSVNLASRVPGNLNALKRDAHKNKNLQELFNKDPAVTVVVKQTETEEAARKLEQYLVDTLLPTGVLCNVAVVDVTKSTFGRKRPDDVVEKIISANTGRKPSEDTRKKMSDAQKKYLTTPEGTARLQKNIEKISRKVTIDGVDYPSILEASRTLGIPYTTLVRKYNL